MSDFTIKVGDRVPKLRMTLLEADGTPIDLTTVESVTLKLRDQRGGALLALAGDGAAAIIAPPLDGVVEYSWGAADTATRVDCFGEWKLTYPGGVTRHVPASSEPGEPNYFTLTIGPSLP
jgi:hypothetical protein